MALFGGFYDHNHNYLKAWEDGITDAEIGSIIARRICITFPKVANALWWAVFGLIGGRENEPKDSKENSVSIETILRYAETAQREN